MKVLNIYIDGSHLNKQNNGRLGIGGVLIDPTKRGKSSIIKEYSTELTPSYMKLEFNADNPSNPSAELTALLHALINFKDELKKADVINVYADYIGVREWMSGKWRVKEPYIKKIKEKIDLEIINQVLSKKIEYHWVKGHQKNDLDLNVYWNNYVDLLAKGK